MKPTLTLLLTVIITLCATSCTTSDDNPAMTSENVSELASIYGVWEGEGQQPGLSWTIKITVGPEAQRIEYPSLECGGTLTLLQASEGNFLFRETITFNSFCADQGFIELLKTSENTLEYNYYFPNAADERGPLGATGQVTKTN